MPITSRMHVTGNVMHCNLMGRNITMPMFESNKIAKNVRL